MTIIYDYMKSYTDILVACEEFVKAGYDIITYSDRFYSLANSLTALEEKELREYVESLASTIDLYWYFMSMDVSPSSEGLQEIQLQCIPYVTKIEKLIIRGTLEGEEITAKEIQNYLCKNKKTEDKLDEYLRIGEEIEQNNKIKQSQ